MDKSILLLLEHWLLVEGGLNAGEWLKSHHLIPSLNGTEGERDRYVLICLLALWARVASQIHSLLASPTLPSHSPSSSRDHQSWCIPTQA